MNSKRAYHAIRILCAFAYWLAFLGIDTLELPEKEEE